MSKPIDDVELARMLHRQGFKGEALRTAFAVIKAESSANPLAFNGNEQTGDRSYGLAQINMLGDMGPERRQRWGLQSDDDLFNPETNIKAMYDLSGGGKSFRDWSVHPESRGRGGKGSGYEAHLTAAEAAAKQVEVPEATGNLGEGDLAAMYPAFDEYVAWSLKKGYKPRGIEKAIVKQLAARRAEYTAMEGVTPAQAAQWADEDFGGQPKEPDNAIIAADKKLAPATEMMGRWAKDYGVLPSLAAGYKEMGKAFAPGDESLMKRAGRFASGGAQAALAPAMPAIGPASELAQGPVAKVEELGQYTGEGLTLGSQKARLQAIMKELEQGIPAEQSFAPNSHRQLSKLFATPQGSPERQALIKQFMDEAVANGVILGEGLGAGAAMLGGNAEVEPERAKALTNTYGETAGPLVAALTAAFAGLADVSGVPGMIRPKPMAPVPPAPVPQLALPPATLKAQPVPPQPRTPPPRPAQKGTVVKEPVAGLLPPGPAPRAGVTSVGQPPTPPPAGPAAPAAAPDAGLAAKIEDLLNRFGIGDETGSVGNLGPRKKRKRPGLLDERGSVGDPDGTPIREPMNLDPAADVSDYDLRVQNLIRAYQEKYPEIDPAHPSFREVAQDMVRNDEDLAIAQATPEVPRSREQQASALEEAKELLRRSQQGMQNTANPGRDVPKEQSLAKVPGQVRNENDMYNAVLRNNAREKQHSMDHRARHFGRADEGAMDPGISWTTPDEARPLGIEDPDRTSLNRIKQREFNQVQLESGRGIEDPSGFSGSKGQEPVYPVRNRNGQEIDHNTVRRRDHQSIKTLETAIDYSQPVNRNAPRANRLVETVVANKDALLRKQPEKIGFQDVVKRFLKGDEGAVPLDRPLRAVKKQIRAEGIDLARRKAKLNTLGKATREVRAVGRVVGNVLDKATQGSFVRAMLERDHDKSKNIMKAEGDYRGMCEKISRIANHDTNILEKARIPLPLQGRAMRFFVRGDITKGLDFIYRHADRLKAVGKLKEADATRLAADTIKRQQADIIGVGVAIAQDLAAKGEKVRPETIIKNLGKYYHRTYSKAPLPAQVEAKVKNTLRRARVVVDKAGKAYVYTLGRDENGVAKAWTVDSGDLPNTVTPTRFSKLSPAQQADVNAQIDRLVKKQLKMKEDVGIPQARTGGAVPNSSVLKKRKLDDPILRTLRQEQRNFGVISNTWNKITRMKMTLDFINNLLDKAPKVVRKGQKMVKLEAWPILGQHAGRAVPKNVFDAFREVLGPKGDGVREFGDDYATVRRFNKLMNWFKLKNTAFNLSSHPVQMGNNMGNMSLAGTIHKVTAHKMAWDALKGVRAGTFPTQKNPVKTPEGWSIYEACEKGGFMGGATVGDYVGKIERAMDRSIYNPEAQSLQWLETVQDMATKGFMTVPQVYNLSDRMAKVSAYIAARGLDGGEGMSLSNWESPHKMTHEEAVEFVDTYFINFQRTNNLIKVIRKVPALQLIVNPFISSKILGLRIWSQVLAKKPLNAAIYGASLGFAYNLYWHLQGKDKEYIEEQREYTAVEWEQFPNRFNVAGPSFYDGAQGWDISRHIPNFEMLKLMKMVPGAPGYDDTDSWASNATLATLQMLGEQFLSGPVAAQGFSRWGIKINPEEEPAQQIFEALAEQILIPGGYRYKTDELIKAMFGKSDKTTGENVLGLAQRTVRFDEEMLAKKYRNFKGKGIELDKAGNRVNRNFLNDDITMDQRSTQKDRLFEKRMKRYDTFGDDEEED